MMGNKSQATINKHHKQVMDAKMRRANMKLKNQAAWKAIKEAAQLQYEYLKLARVFYLLAFLLALVSILTVGLWMYSNG